MTISARLLSAFYCFVVLALLSSVVNAQPQTAPGTQAFTPPDSTKVEYVKKHDYSPVYPPLALTARIQGQVTLKVQVDGNGKVINIRAISGHPMLVPAAADAARLSRFNPYFRGGRPVTFWTTLTYNFEGSMSVKPGMPGPAEFPDMPSTNGTTAESTKELSPEHNSVPPDSTKLLVKHAEKATYPYQAEVDKRQGQVLIKMHIDEAGNVTTAEALSGDDLFREPALKAAKKWRFEPFIKGGKAVPVVTTIPFDFAFRGGVKDEPEALTMPNNSKPSESTQNSASGPTEGAPPLPTRVRVSQGVSQGLLLHKVNPMYPPEAKHKGITGSVVLQAVIGKDGAISGLHAVSGPRELVQSAMDAVQQWRYRPYVLKGEPVEVETQITVNYTLSSF